MMPVILTEEGKPGFVLHRRSMSRRTLFALRFLRFECPRAHLRVAPARNLGFEILQVRLQIALVDQLPADFGF